MNLYSLLERSSRKGMALQNRSTGSMPPGHNGPYGDPQTPVRNTGHWLMLFLKSYEISGDKAFKEAAERALDYLQSSEARPMGAAFYHRTNPEKDVVNGLIGQAWTIEALVYAGLSLGREKPLNLAEELFLMHPFYEKGGIWQRVAADGMHLSFDETFNHQLWFAAAAAPLAARSEEVAGRIGRFLDKLPVNLRTYSTGLIYHPLLIRYTVKQKLKEMKRVLTQRRSTRRALRHKAIGYHLFNLYGFAMLHEAFPDHSFWKTRKFRKTLAFASTPTFAKSLESNPYGYPYNPPGFEMAYAAARFDFEATPDRVAWVKKQITRCYNPDDELMNLNTEDPETQAARLYEAVRLEDMDLAGLEFGSRERVQNDRWPGAGPEGMEHAQDEPPNEGSGQNDSPDKGSGQNDRGQKEQPKRDSEQNEPENRGL